MNERNTRMLFSVALAIAAYLVVLLFGFLGFALVGAGHGSGIFGYLFYSPVIGSQGSHFCLGLVIWPAVGLLLPWARSLIVSCLVLILLGFSYYGIFQDMMADISETGTTSYAIKVMKSTPDLVFLIVSVFALMQIAILGSLVYLRISKPKNTSPTG
jgi:hypothetical protein